MLYSCALQVEAVAQVSQPDAEPSSAVARRRCSFPVTTVKPASRIPAAPAAGAQSQLRDQVRLDQPGSRAAQTSQGQRAGEEPPCLVNPAACAPTTTSTAPSSPFQWPLSGSGSSGTFCATATASTTTPCRTPASPSTSDGSATSATPSTAPCCSCATYGSGRGQTKHPVGCLI